MHVTDQTGNFRFEVNMLGKEEFGVTNVGVGAKGYVLAESAADLVVEFGAFHVAQESQHKEPPVLFLELHVDGILFAEAKIDRGLVLDTDGTHIMKRFRFVDLDLDDAILESRIVEEAGTIELKVLDATVQPSVNDEDEYLLPSLYNDRGAISLLNEELNNTVGVRFDDGEKSIADSKYASRRQSTDYILARRTWPLGKLMAQVSFTYGSIDLVNSLGGIPQDHRYFKDRIVAGQPTSRYPRYVETDLKLIHKALFESDYTLGAKLREKIQFENSSQISNPSPSVILSTENQNEQESILPKNQISKQEPKEIRIPRSGTLRADTPPITPQKTPAQIAKPCPLILKVSRGTPEIKSLGGIGPLTPDPTPRSISPIYISSDEEDITFPQERKVRGLQDSPLRFRGRKQGLKQKSAS